MNDIESTNLFLSRQFGIIYKVTNLVNGKVYIGQTVRTLKGRISEHFYNANNGLKNEFFRNAILKYGKESFEWQEIDLGYDKNDLDKKEVYWISFYNSTNRNWGYNISIGGESRQKIDVNKATVLIYEGKNLREISEILGCNRGCLAARLEAFLGKEKYSTLVWETKIRNQKKKLIIIVKEDLEKELSFRKSTREIAKTYNTNKGVIKKRIIEFFGETFYKKYVKSNTARTKEKIKKIHHFNNTNKIRSIKDIIIRWENGESIKKIAKSLGMCSKTLTRYIKEEYGEDKYRNRAESNSKHKKV